MPQQQLIVLKFGGSVLRNEEDLATAVHEVYRWARHGLKVVAVVSAFEGTTDTLLTRARQNAGDQELDEHATALLLATGEFQTASLLTLALSKAGVPARVLSPQSVQLRVRRAGLDSDPESLNAGAIRTALASAPVVVIPGFVGVDEQGTFTLLGRGGSDLSAVYVASKLSSTRPSGSPGVRCRLIKDVDGLYERDPALGGPKAARFEHLSWAHAEALGGGIVQAKALRTAAEHGQTIEIAAFAREHCTRVGPFEARLYDDWLGQPPLGVTLLGAGSVGGGVYAHLKRLHKDFTVTGVVVRDQRLAAERGFDRHVLSTDAVAAAAAPGDIVVEQLGGLEPAASAIRAALRAGKHVVTANKAVVAAYADEFEALADAAGVRFLYSAAVGGAVPMLEVIDQARGKGQVVRVEGLLNGTCNFILNEVAAGSSFERALKRAQAAGYAEADPTRDLSGLDAADKLSLLIRRAFAGIAGTNRPLPSVREIARTALNEDTLTTVRAAASTASRLRQVAWAEQAPDGHVRAGVEIRAVSTGDALFEAPGARNRLVITDASGRRTIADGVGAGRWPTAEAVLADLLDIRRGRASLLPVGELDASRSLAMSGV